MVSWSWRSIKLLLLHLVGVPCVITSVSNNNCIFYKNISKINYLEHFHLRPCTSTANSGNTDINVNTISNASFVCLFVHPTYFDPTSGRNHLVNKNVNLKQYVTKCMSLHYYYYYYYVIIIKRMYWNVCYIYVNSCTISRLLSETNFIGYIYCTFAIYFNAYVL
jgi:hypothetical protein